MTKENLLEKLEAMEKALDEGFKGLITETTETTNEKFFKSDEKGTAGIYDIRDGMEVTIKLNSPNGETFNQFFGLPKTTGLKQSNLALFKKRYGSYPKKGLEVDVVLSDEGFFRVVL